MLRAFVLIGTALGAASWATGGIQYQVTAIQSGAVGSGLNNDGAAVGTYGRDAFWWTPTGGFHRDARVYDNWGADINDAGVMVGYTKTTFDYGRLSRYGTFAYNVWTGEDVSSTVSRVDKSNAINNLNLTAGSEWSYDAPNGSHYVGYSFHAHPDTGAVFARSWGEGYGVSDINDHSVAVGSNARVVTPLDSFFLPKPDAGTTTANGINDRWGLTGGGLICGVADEMPCYWDGAGNLHRLTPAADAATNPDAIDYTSGVFRRVNDHGQMVGYLQVNGRGQAAAIYQNGRMTLLEDLIVPGQATALASAVDVNDRGQVLAQTSANVCVLLSPVYFADGAFAADSLDTSWAATGPGTAATIDLGGGDFCVELTAGSPVTLSQNVATPDAPFELSFDLRFLTTDPSATLTVELAGDLLDVLSPPDTPAAGFRTRRIMVTDPSLWGLVDAPLALTYDGPSGTQVLLDNVTITQAIPEPTPIAAVLLALPLFSRLRRRRR